MWLLLLQGMIIGTGAILPGVSGGVLCLAFGLYEPMIQLFTHPLPTLRRHLRLFLPLIGGGLVGLSFWPGWWNTCLPSPRGPP